MVKRRRVVHLGEAAFVKANEAIRNPGGDWRMVVTPYAWFVETYHSHMED